MPRQQFLKVPESNPLTEEQLRKMAEEARQRFEAMTEADQVLHLLSKRLCGVRGYASTYEKQMTFARDVIAFTCGPKFAERVLSEPESLKKLHLDPESFVPRPPSMTVVRG